MQRESITTSEAFMIGDRKLDIIGAKENGIFGVGVLWGYGTKDEFEGGINSGLPYSPCYLVPSAVRKKVLAEAYFLNRTRAFPYLIPMYQVF